MRITPSRSTYSSVRNAVESPSRYRTRGSSSPSMTAATVLVVPKSMPRYIADKPQIAQISMIFLINLRHRCDVWLLQECRRNEPLIDDVERLGLTWPRRNWQRAQRFDDQIAVVREQQYRIGLLCRIACQRDETP